MVGGQGIERRGFFGMLHQIYYSIRKGLLKYRKNRIQYDDVVMPWTIIQKNLSIKDYEHRFRNLHADFKYKFLVPLVLFAHWILRRCMMPKSKIPDEEHNRLIRAWLDNFDVTLKEWCLYYRQMDVTDAQQMYLKNASTDMLRKLNDILVLGYMHDASYRPFFDMLILNMAIKVGELYPGKIGAYVYQSKYIDDYNYRIITGRTDEHMILNCGTYHLVVKKGDAIKVENIDMKRFKEEQKRNSSDDAKNNTR